jgi:hypothetical protein
MTIKKTLLHMLIYISNVYIYMSTRKEELKVKEKYICE